MASSSNKGGPSKDPGPSKDNHDKPANEESGGNEAGQNEQQGEEQGEEQEAAPFSYESSPEEFADIYLRPSRASVHSTPHHIRLRAALLAYLASIDGEVIWSDDEAPPPANQQALDDEPDNDDGPEEQTENIEEPGHDEAVEQDGVEQDGVEQDDVEQDAAEQDDDDYANVGIFHMEDIDDDEEK